MPAEQLSDTDILTTGQVADLLQVAPRTAGRLIDDGEIEGYRLPGGNHRRATAAALADFILRHRFPVPAPMADLVDRFVIEGNPFAPKPEGIIHR